MPIIAPNITRFAVNGSYAGQPVVNVLDMRRTIVSGGPIDTPEWNLTRANVIAAAYVDFFAPRLSTQMIWESIDWIDLGSITGDVGTTTGGTSLLPATGAISGSVFPANVALRLRKNAGGQRGSRPGSMYIAGLAESATASNPNTLDATNLAAWETACESFHAEINSDVSVDSGVYGAELVILRTRRPSPDAQPVFVEASTVTALVPQSRLASQRRRLTL